MGETALIVGLGVTGESVARYLLAEGWNVVAVDERPTELTRSRAIGLGPALELVESPADERIDSLVRASDMVVLSPGIPPHHRAVTAARQSQVPLRSEIEIALGALGGRPVLAVTGTNGKTTVATLVTAMLVEDGVQAVAAGNIGLPFVDAVAGPADCFVLEVSSFQLEQTESLKPSVGAWLNLAQDHLDWHPDMGSYAHAKARVWMNQDETDVAVANADDPVVIDMVKQARSRLVTFGSSGADFHVRDTESGPTLCGPDGEPIVSVAALVRRLPLDIENSLAALAMARSAGVSTAACASVLATYSGLPHRVQRVGHSGGVEFFDDSKATTPASVLAALRGFDSVVLIAGGRNKGLDLSVLAQEAHRIRSVVAIGDAADEVWAAFEGLRPVSRANSMVEAVAVARSSAQAGDVVLLSPGCASFDWYSSYAERGDDFARAVAEAIR